MLSRRDLGRRFSLVAAGIAMGGEAAFAQRSGVHAKDRGQLVFLTVLGVYFIRRFGVAKGLIAGALLGMPILLLGGRSGEEADSSAMERTGR